MSTPAREIRSLALWKLVPVIAACWILAGCGDGPTAPAHRTVPTPSVGVTPTPVPIPNVAGSWQGVLTAGGPAALCGHNVPATATFNQEGARVTGTVTTPPSVRTFVGELRGAQLTGTLTNSGTPVVVTGTATSNYMRMSFGGSFFCRTVSIQLNR